MRLGRQVIWTVAVAAVLGLVHLLLLYGLSGSGVVAAVFAAGDPLSAAVALLFVVLRFATLVLLPGWLLYRAVKIVFGLMDARRRA